MLSEAAPAKVNLTLHVTGRRSDGYHLLDSLVVFAGAHDRLTARLADDVSLTLSGPFAAGLEAETDNLVLRAARGLQLACGVRAGAALHLEKNLPVASGIGGGSSDAAAALRLLGRLWGVDTPADRLVALAAKLGADVPVCLRPRAWCMGGIGEVLQPAPALPECGLMLVNPGVAVSTPAVFRARTGVFSAAALWPARWDTAASMALDLAENANDLQAAAIGLCPAIGEAILALRRVESCLLARMSGSGATCFGLFASASAASAAAAALARPGWWCWGGGLWGG